MLELLVVVYQNWQNYIFGSFTITYLALLGFLLMYVFVHGFSIETTLVMVALGLMVTAVWLMPVWTVTIVLVLLGLVLAWGISKLFGGSN